MLIIIPARGGSKRLTKKNIRSLRGKPLLLFAIEVARKAGVGAEIVVSTEDAAIAKVAREARARVIDRPDALAADSASTESVLLHALDVMQEEGRSFDWVMTLPPSSPLRCPRTIVEFAGIVRKEPEAQDCLMSIHENRGDFWTSNPDGSLQRLFPHAPRRQQDREPLWEENSAIYVTDVLALRSTGSILGNRVRGVPIDPIEALDIHTECDLRTAEAFLSHWGGEIPDFPPDRKPS
jgi:CMP-N-acetylneuraminic acid synthetase